MTPLTGPSMLALVADMTGPTLWRALWPITALERRGYPCGWEYKDAALAATVAAKFDGCLLSRVSWPPGQWRLVEHALREAHDAGRFWVYDCDDDLFGEDSTHRLIEMEWTDGRSLEALEAERSSRLWAMQVCDGVTVTTPYLASVVHRLTDKPVIVVPNAIDVVWFRGVVRATRREISGLTIGWAGGKRPDADLTVMAEAWARIAARYRSVRFIVGGYLPPPVVTRLPADRLTVLPWARLERYPALLKEIDIACCAVSDTPFNRAKTPIKALEAALAGSAVVATPTLYGELVEDNQTGRLAATVDEWESALSELIERPALRLMLARRLQRVVEREHALERNLWRWPQAWSTIQQAARARHRRVVAG
jgi:glycosyltransferase involved in cell wall biosynthesis